MNHTALNRENTQLLQKKSPRKKIGSDFLFLGLKIVSEYDKVAFLILFNEF